MVFLKAPRDVEGYYGPAGCNVGVTGCVWDKAHPSGIMRVDIFDGTRYLGIVDAGWYEWHLVKAGIGNGRHVFSYVLPWELKDG
jgi:hypothetical protein